MPHAGAEPPGQVQGDPGAEAVPRAAEAAGTRYVKQVSSGSPSSCSHLGDARKHRLPGRRHINVHVGAGADTLDSATHHKPGAKPIFSGPSPPYWAATKNNGPFTPQTDPPPPCLLATPNPFVAQPFGHQRDAAVRKRAEG